MNLSAWTVFAAVSDIPAPMWFVEFFKILGFVLHSIPMNLWYAGLIVAFGMSMVGGEQGRLFANRFLRQMPVIISVGVNLGIVPLLFTQLAYYRFFYSATILIAWSWLAIIVLLIPAYYGVYAYAWGLKNGEPLAWWRRVAGGLAALFFLAIGFLFAHGFSLVDHVDRWQILWNQHQFAGAATGTALNIGDATLWPRWLLMFGLAQTTTAVWILVDLTLFFRSASEAYRAWAWKFARNLYTVGMIVSASAGTWYVFGTWSKDLFDTMFHGWLLPLTILTAVATGLPWLMIVFEKRFPSKMLLALGIIASQIGVLAINAISRQVVQNVNLDLHVSGGFKVLDQATTTQVGPLVMFLVSFVFGLGVVGWMLAQVVKSPSPQNRDP